MNIRIKKSDLEFPLIVLFSSAFLALLLLPIAE